jgi:hypothetical protein
VIPLLDQLIGDLAALAPAALSANGVSLVTSALDLDLPIEALIANGLRASLPRGRLATGFDPPLCRLRARFETEPA